MEQYDNESIFKQSIIDLQSNKLTQSIQEFTNCIQRQPKSVYFLNRGIAFANLKKYQQSLQDFQKAANIQPYNPFPYYNLSTLYLQQGSFGSALNHLSNCLSCLYLKKALIYNCEQYADKAIQYSQNNVQAKLFKVICKIKIQNFSEALQILNQILNFHPNKLILYQIRSDIYTQLQEVQLLAENQQQIEKIKNQVNNQQQISLSCDYDAVSQEETHLLIQKYLCQFSTLFSQLYGSKAKKSESNNLWLLSIHNFSENQSPQTPKQYQFLEDCHQAQSQINQNQQQVNKQDQTSDPINTQPRQLQEINIVSQDIIPLQINNNQLNKQQFKDKRKDNSIYPLHSKNMNVFIKQCEVYREQQKLIKMVDVYCLFYYNNSKIKSKPVKALPKSVWQQNFEVQISPNPQNLKIKVDDFIGEGEVEASYYGVMCVPIYSKGVQTGKVAIELIFNEL